MKSDIGGFLVGLGAGVGLGMLLAPRSGEKTRSLLRSKVNEGVDYVRKQGTDLRDAATDIVGEGARTVTKGTEAVKAAVEAGKNAYSDALRS